MGDGSVVPVAVGLAVGVMTTKDLNDVKQFFSTYPTANTTVYFITTCTDESCLSLGRIPSVVEYWFKSQDQKYSELRIEINYQKGEAVFSQVRCTVYGIEGDGVGMRRAAPLEGVSLFLRDSRCPAID